MDEKKGKPDAFLYFCKVILVDMPQLCSLGQWHLMETVGVFFLKEEYGKFEESPFHPEIC